MRIVNLGKDSQPSPHAFEEKELLPNEKIIEHGGTPYLVRIGVIDVEGKLYTKLPIYIREVEKAYMNFVKYFNRVEEQQEKADRNNEDITPLPAHQL